MLHLIVCPEQQWKPACTTAIHFLRWPGRVIADFPVVLDACVLIPMPLAHTLLRLAGGPWRLNS
jgi:hypothetical protein